MKTIDRELIKRKDVIADEILKRVKLGKTDTPETDKLLLQYKEIEKFQIGIYKKK